MDEQAEFLEICEQLEAQGYRRTDRNIMPALGLPLSFACAMPLVWVVGVAYQRFALARSQVAPLRSTDFMLSLVVTALVAVAAHEIVRALVWMLCSKQGFAAVGLRQKGCWCRVALPRSAYLAGLLAPLVLLGTGTVVALLVWPCTVTLLLAFISLMACGSDLLLAFFLLSAKNAIIVDDPDEIGFAILQR